MKRITFAIGILSFGLVLSLAASSLGRLSQYDTVSDSSKAANGVLVSAPDMSITRAAHTATALADGRILVAGGFVENGSAQGAEIYDSDAASFVALPPMINTRHSHTSTILPDGKVLLVGGFGEGSSTLGSAELFDPTTNIFTSTGSLNAARAGHVAVLLENGKVLVAGGLGPGWEFLSSAELYDPASGEFTSTGGMTVARESHVAVRLLDGRVLIVGGHRGRRANIILYTSAEIYDPATGVFSHVADMNIRRHKHDGVLLPDGQVLITGGSDERDDRGVYDSAELFNPETGIFSLINPMNVGRYKHIGNSLVLPNGKVLIAGGATQAEIFDPNSRTFTLVSGDTQMAGQFSAVAPLKDGGALITGGYGNRGGPRSSAWLYRP